MGKNPQSSAIAVEQKGNILLVRLCRTEKRNALNDGMVQTLECVFTSVPEGIGALVLHGEGANFSAGLDLSELSERDAVQGVMHSRMWHQALDRIQFGKVPVIAALQGAVIGGGLELACAAHIRVVERSAYYALPEGRRGIFVGGGGSVRLPRLVGVALMMDMMMTGRVIKAEEGRPLGFSQYLVDDGGGLATAMELAGTRLMRPGFLGSARSVANRHGRWKFRYGFRYSRQKVLKRTACRCGMCP